MLNPRFQNIKEIYLPRIGDKYGKKYHGWIMRVEKSSSDPWASSDSVEIPLRDDDAYCTLNAEKYNLSPGDLVRLNTQRNILSLIDRIKKLFK